MWRRRSSIDCRTRRGSTRGTARTRRWALSGRRCRSGGPAAGSRQPPSFTVRLPCAGRYADVMRPLRYSINVTLDGCCDHREMVADEDLHRHATENLAQADALLFGRVTYEMMEAAWRPPAGTVAR